MVGNVFVDGLGIGDVGNIVIHDRQHLAEGGIVIVVVALDENNEVQSGPEIVSRGFVYVRGSEGLMEECREVIWTSLDKIRELRLRDHTKIKSEIRESLGSFLWRKTHRSPMIIPIILDI